MQMKACEIAGAQSEQTAVTDGGNVENATILFRSNYSN